MNWKYVMLAGIGLAGSLQGAEKMNTPTPENVQPNPVRISGILYNEDDSHRFILDAAGKMEPERLDALVDELADTEVSAMLICCCAKKTNFPSTSWEPHCDGYDPANLSDKWSCNLKRMLDLGVDPTGRMLERCRERGISPWVSMRMNDVHDANKLDSRLHSRFWREHPEYWRDPEHFKSWNDRCLNYALEPVRDHAMALIREVCGRYDMDGFELDWNRFPLHFRQGEEQAGAAVLTEWLKTVRAVVRDAEQRVGHRIVLAARVPALPEVALGTGLDAVTWAKLGLIDHLIVAPFWATTDFDIPVDRWLELLDGTGVGVTAGLEIRVQPTPGGPTIPNTAERRRGAAMAALARGSQGIYLFNYFDIGRAMPGLLKEMNSVETLQGKNRSYVVTYHDIHIPGVPLPRPLPRTLSPGESVEWNLYTGPRPIQGARGSVNLSARAETAEKAPSLRVQVNGLAAQELPEQGTFAFERDAFRDGNNTVSVTNASAEKITVECVELCVRFPNGPGE